MLQTQQSLVKYTPAIELADPDFDENLQTVMGATKEYIEESVKGEGLNRAVRDAHAKGYGLVRAEVEILDGLAPEYAQGIYALPGRHEALIRCNGHGPETLWDRRSNAAGRRAGLPYLRLRVDQRTNFLLQHSGALRVYPAVVSERARLFPQGKARRAPISP